MRGRSVRKFKLIPFESVYHNACFNRSPTRTTLRWHCYSPSMRLRVTISGWSKDLQGISRPPMQRTFNSLFGYHFQSRNSFAKCNIRIEVTPSSRNNCIEPLSVTFAAYYFVDAKRFSPSPLPCVRPPAGLDLFDKA